MSPGGPALDVVLLAALLRLLIGDHLANVLHHKGAGTNPLDTPASAVVCPEDGQLVLSTVLNDPVDAVQATCNLEMVTNN